VATELASASGLLLRLVRGYFDGFRASECMGTGGGGKLRMVEENKERDE